MTNIVRSSTSSTVHVRLHRPVGRWRPLRSLQAASSTHSGLHVLLLLQWCCSKAAALRRADRCDAVETMAVPLTTHQCVRHMHMPGVRWARIRMTERGGSQLPATETDAA